MPRIVPGTLAFAALALAALSGHLPAQGPRPDPRVGLRGGPHAAQAVWNLKVLSTTPPSPKFVGSWNTDLAFRGKFVIQGNYNGYQIWDISEPYRPELEVSNYCPASQSDVSVYRNLLFVSAEGNTGRIDCGDQGVKDTVSAERIKGIRIFDISDIAAPRHVVNVQTCRGSHTHSLLIDPKDKANVYVYISGSAPTRPAGELAGCIADKDDPNTAEFRLEVIKVPLAHPEQAAVVSSPRIFNQLALVTAHGRSQSDLDALADAKAKNGFVVTIRGVEQVFNPYLTAVMLDSISKSHGRTAWTAADSAELRAGLPAWVTMRMGHDEEPNPNRPAVTSCHDITLYPAIGLAAGACEGYGLLVDIKDPAHPVRIGAVSDSNFSYWHSATFNNDGSKILFSDEWGGGMQPKCRVRDPKEWGADALFTVSGGKMEFKGYYKVPVVQTPEENCVAHNGSLIPIPGRDVMAQSWYQAGISVFDWTDAAHPREIAYFDRGPVDTTRMVLGGSWSVYWYNGVLVSSEITRGLDIFALTPSPFLTQNEIDAAKTVPYDYLNTQGQQQMVWPPSFALAGAYLDQLARIGDLPAERIARVRRGLVSAQRVSPGGRRRALVKLSAEIPVYLAASRDKKKVELLARAVGDLAK